MNNIYLTVALCFCIIVIIKLLYDKNKATKNLNKGFTSIDNSISVDYKNQKEVINTIVYQKPKPKNKARIKRLKTRKSNQKEVQNNSLNHSDVPPEIVSKNKWLYPTDEFGKMERGVTVESRTFIYEKKENNNSDFTIN